MIHTRCSAIFLVVAIACGDPERGIGLDGGSGGDAQVGLDGAGQPDAAPVDCGQDDGRLDLNDVSFLFPPPADLSDLDALLALSAQGPHGRLLAEETLAALPPAPPLGPDPQYGDWRVVAARVDPCFRGVEAGECRRQLRLVAQPFLATAIAADTTLHLFYDLDADEFARLREDLAALKQLAGAATWCRPLGVHPVMLEEGLSGPYAVRLRELITAHGGEQHLSRLAIMQLELEDTHWAFSAFDIEPDTGPVPDPIPRLAGATTQDFIVLDFVDNGSIDPAPETSALAVLFSTTEVTRASLEELQAAGQEVLTIADPLRADPTTIDCVSCHVAERGLALARSVRDFDVGDPSLGYVNAAFDLSKLDDGIGIMSQRAFGYFSGSPSLTGRVIHESAEVAQQLNAAP